MGAATGFAQAADVPVLPPVVVEPEPDMFDWSGFYIGAHGGGAWSNSTVTLTDPAGVVIVTPDGDAINDFDQAGGVIGAQAGVLMQTGQFVLGVEGDVQWAGLGADFEPFTSGFPVDDFQVSIDGMASIRGKLGFAVDKVLIYATAGLAVGSVSTQYRTPAGGVDAFNYSELQVGYTVGAGAAFAVTDNISLFGEYRFTDLGESSGDALIGPAGTSTTRTTVHTGLVGFNFHL
jgi:outer membrane immunogenic protein